MHFNRFDPSTIKSDRIMVALGMRGSGKSTVMRAICLAMKEKFDVTFGVSPTYSSRDFMKHFMPSSCVHSKTSVIKPVVNELLKFQNDLSLKGYTKDHVNPKKRLKTIFIMMDDCAFDKELTKGIEMRELVMNGRHCNIFVLEAVQYCVDLPPPFRQNSDYIIAMREPLVDNRKKLYQYFFGIFPDFKTFEKVFADMTSNFGCMVLDKTIPTTNPEECVFHYRAPEHTEDFQMGSNIQWSLYRKYYLSLKDQIAAEDAKTGKSAKADALQAAPAKAAAPSKAPVKKDKDAVVLVNDVKPQKEDLKVAEAVPFTHVTLKSFGVEHSRPGQEAVDRGRRRSSLNIARSEFFKASQNANAQSANRNRASSVVGKVNPSEYVKKFENVPSMHQSADASRKIRDYGTAHDSHLVYKNWNSDNYERPFKS